MMQTIYSQLREWVSGRKNKKLRDKDGCIAEHIKKIEGLKIKIFP